jgi:serpin B
MNALATLRSDFAARLYDKVASAEPVNNVFLSPFSVQVALAMCAVGARGETRRVLADLIGAPANVDEQNRQYAELLKSINGTGQRPFQLLSANALWGQRSYRFDSEFRQTVVHYYEGAFEEVDFRTQPDAAVKKINDWVSTKTRSRIQGLILRSFIHPNTSLVLTNAIYFRGAWERQFDESQTRKEDWYGTDSRKVPMMHRRARHLYYENDNLQAIDLPYEGGTLSMVVVLPRRHDGLADLESEWVTGGTYQDVVKNLQQEQTVQVGFPRFKIETGCNLRTLLCDLGATLVFSSKADFSGISTEPLTISEAVHKAMVEVNEQGTEAAAATAIGLRSAAAIAPPPKTFQADHPFLFCIRERKTGAVLFCGRVLDPK